MKTPLSTVTYRSTRIACYIGYVVQAIINNLSPVLFIVYQDRFQIDYSRLSFLVLVNFLTQLLVDVLSVRLVDKIGYRVSITAAHIFSALGLCLLGLLPRLISPYAGLLLATVVCAAGSGLIEVLVSPTIEALPLPNKSSQMSLLHSFYCWGQLAVVLLSTLLLQAAGHDHWYLLPLLWAVLPLANLILFLRVPIVEPTPEEKSSVRCMLTSRLFLVSLVLMLCAGAAELAMSQWSSLFAEKSLGISKVAGDLLGPCMFALLMGTGRLLYGIFGKYWNIQKGLMLCAGLSVLSYLIASLSPRPTLSLVGFALGGLAVSLMWPGTFSLSAEYFPKGGTAMFALLAVFGDLGCATGPALTGFVSDWAEETPAISMNSLNAGLLTGTVFGILMLASLLLLRLRKTK